ncbi:hypothetical protein GOODEAATRI_009124 [Goodea atripinnis]|uniref:Uncharacterized protein n=1 Tax=Goodea atripinnis TaxID=208336 RepID=A0ABV0P5C1_9TELE
MWILLPQMCAFESLAYVFHIYEGKHTIHNYIHTLTVVSYIVATAALEQTDRSEAAIQSAPPGPLTTINVKVQLFTRAFFIIRYLRTACHLPRVQICIDLNIRIGTILSAVMFVNLQFTQL